MTDQKSPPSRTAKWLAVCAGQWAKAVDAFSMVHPWCAEIVRYGSTSLAIGSEAFKAFYDIKEDDESLEKIKKVGATEARGFVFYVADYWATFVCAAMVSTLNYWAWSFWAIVAATWGFGFVFAIFALIACHYTGQDFTLGSSHRRVADTFFRRSKLVGISYYLGHNIKATIWDGPEEVVYFYKDQIRNVFLIASMVFVLTFLQGLFWAWVYSMGYETVTDSIKYLL
jgi:hypothetical protein